MPVDPDVLSLPSIAKGIDNAVAGFNSSIATVEYALRPLQTGGEVVLGAGSDSLNYQMLRLAAASGESAASGDRLAAQLSLAMSEGDGSLPNGDHDFSRYNLHLQRSGGDAQSDLILAYQDKFYGWPGAYTGFANLAETDDTQTTLVFANHRQELEQGWFELGAYYRRLEDDYDFDRTTSETGEPGSFEHETEVYAIGVQGLKRSGAIAWRYGAQLTADELVFSTDLTEGNFNSRSYATVTLVPSIQQALDDGRVVTWRLGASVDHSNRDDTEVLPLAGVSLERTTGSASTTWSLDYARTSQVPGYTVLNSRPAGLFGGNPDLGRERADQLSL